MHSIHRRKIALLPILAALFLYLNIVLFQTSGPINLAILMLLGVLILPYVLCAVLLFSYQRNFEAFFGSILPLIADIGVYYSVFIDPSHTHASLLYIVTWKVRLFVLLPAGLIIGWVASKLVSRHRENAS